MPEDELSSALDFFGYNQPRERYIREYTSSTARNNRSYSEQISEFVDRAVRMNHSFEFVDHTARMNHSGLGTISHPTGDSISTIVAYDNLNSSYRIIEMDKNTILQLIENAIMEGKINHKDIILLFAKLKEAKSEA